MTTDGPVTPSEDCYKEAVFIETMSGQWWLDKPFFEIEDIAHALSLNCRFNGHIRHFYSVAQHSLMVANLMASLALGDPLEGLLHDATEAYMSDVPAPLKVRLPDWRGIDATLEAKLRAHYNLPAKKSHGCGVADWYALFIEAYYLQPRKGVSFMDPQNFRGRALELAMEDDRFRPKERNPKDVEAEFIKLYLRYRRGM